MRYTKCDKCGKDISNNNYKKHINSCQGVTTHEKGQCKYCLEKFDLSDKPNGWLANHTRWCEKNPKHDQYISELSERMKDVNDSLSDESRQKMAESIKSLHVSGAYDSMYKKNKEKPPMKGKKHSDTSKQKMQEKALASDHRRLKRKMIEFEKDGEIILLDSTWELILAERLDSLSVEWTRPKTPLKWIDKNGLERNYFPDFYLPEYDLYLDPKNEFAYKVQKEKIDVLNETYNNIKWILGEDECRTYQP